MRKSWLLVLGCLISAPAAAALYKHVDAAGTVTYSDRPQQPDQEALRLPPPNVATPEARRQLELARQGWEREELAEYEARMRRSAAAYRTPQAAPRTTPPVYHVAYARITTQGYLSQGLQPARVSHRTGHARR